MALIEQSTCTNRGLSRGIVSLNASSRLFSVEMENEKICSHIGMYKDNINICNFWYFTDFCCYINEK